MIDDPIVAEVREARAKLMAECGYDLNRLFDRLREMERQHPEKYITKEQLDAVRGRNTAQKTAGKYS
jgi:hypothetical protein